MDGVWVHWRKTRFCIIYLSVFVCGHNARRQSASASKRRRWPTCRSGRQERDCAHFSAPSPAASRLKWRSAISMYLLVASFLSPGRWQIATCFRSRLLRAAEAAKWIKVEVAPERLPRTRLCNLLDTAVRRVCRRPRLLQFSALDHKSLKLNSWVIIFNSARDAPLKLLNKKNCRRDWNIHLPLKSLRVHKEANQYNEIIYFHSGSLKCSLHNIKFKQTFSRLDYYSLMQQLYIEGLSSYF